MIAKMSQRDAPLLALKVERGNQEPRDVDSLGKRENTRNRFSPTAPRREQPTIALTLAH